MHEKIEGESDPVSICVEGLEKTKRELTEHYKRDMAELDRAIANVKKLPVQGRKHEPFYDDQN